MLRHELHTTRPYLREPLGIFQIDPITARIVIDSQPESDSRRIKMRRRARGLDEGKSDRIELFSNANKLSSRLRLHGRRVRYPRIVGGAEGMDPCLAGVLNGSAATEHEAHLGASENAGGSVPFPRCPFFIYFTAQSGPNDDRGTAPRHGVIHTRANGVPILKGGILFVVTLNIPQPI